MLGSALALVAATSSTIESAPKSTHDDHLPHSHTHSPAEVDEDQDAVLLQLTYSGEIMGNASGGLRRGARYLDNLDIVVDADMEKLVGWTGAQFHIYGLYNNGKSISAFAGDAQAVSNIEAGTRALRLYEAWINQRIGERLSLKVGLYDLNSEFDVLDAAGLFVSSPNGIGTDFAQSGQNGPSIFPSTSLAARVQWQPSDGWAVRAAVLDGVPGNPNHPDRTAIKLGDDDGALLVGELEAPLRGGKLLLGHWQYTGRFDLNDGNGSGKGNAGTYVRGEYSLIDSDGRKVDIFFRLGKTASRFNMFGSFASTGLKFGGWVPRRADDEFGIALAAAFTSDSYRSATGAGPSEIAIEATYHTPVAAWLALQPSVHYIRNPSANRSISDALVIGLRVEFSIQLGTN